MAKCFISYRKSDSAAIAGRLHESLSQRLGKESVFRDNVSMNGGARWDDIIEASITKKVVVLALIGPNWLAKLRERAGSGARDWNLFELELAVKRNCRIIPLLADEARMPSQEDLPETIKVLPQYLALRLRDDDWKTDIDKLVESLKNKTAPLTQPTASQRRSAILGISAAAVVVGGMGYSLYVKSSSNPSADPADSGISLPAHCALLEERLTLAENARDRYKGEPPPQILSKIDDTRKQIRRDCSP